MQDDTYRAAVSRHDEMCSRGGAQLACSLVPELNVMFFSAICLFCRKANVAYFYSLGRQRQTNADSSSPWIAYSGTIYCGLSQLLPYTKPMFPSKGKWDVAIRVSCQDAAGCGVQGCWVTLELPMFHSMGTLFTALLLMRCMKDSTQNRDGLSSTLTSLSNSTSLCSCDFLSGYFHTRIQVDR